MCPYLSHRYCTDARSDLPEEKGDIALCTAEESIWIWVRIFFLHIFEIHMQSCWHQRTWLPFSINSKTVSPFHKIILQMEKDVLKTQQQLSYSCAASFFPGSANILEMMVQILCSAHNHPPLVPSVRNMGTSQWLKMTLSNHSSSFSHKLLFFQTDTYNSENQRCIEPEPRPKSFIASPGLSPILRCCLLGLHVFERLEKFTHDLGFHVLLKKRRSLTTLSSHHSW